MHPIHQKCSAAEARLEEHRAACTHGHTKTMPKSLVPQPPTTTFNAAHTQGPTTFNASANHSIQCRPHPGPQAHLALVADAALLEARARKVTGPPC